MPWRAAVNVLKNIEDLFLKRQKYKKCPQEMPWRAVVNVFKDIEDFFLLQEYKKCSQEMPWRAAVNVFKNIEDIFLLQKYKKMLSGDTMKDSSGCPQKYKIQDPKYKKY